jgi:beta-mannanase
VAWLQVGAAGAADCKATLGDGTVKQGRTTEGEIRKIAKDEMVIAKSGEMLELVPHDGTVVSGLKDSYKKLKKNDYVKVCFHRAMTKKDPRFAWSIEVVPKPDDGAVDAE